jgi:hypothetical protein
MPLLQFVMVLIVVGVLLWLLNTYGGPYIDAAILKIINVVVIIAVILWVLVVFGLLPLASTVRVPHVGG